LPEQEVSGRWLIHFGAVDYDAEVWLDGNLVGTHEGGYTPFTVDLTRRIYTGGEHELVVRAHDDPLDLSKPRGKQDWQIEPHSIWYFRTTGIWQTVWVERVPDVSLQTLHWTAYLDRMEVGVTAEVAGRVTSDCKLRIRLSLGDRLLADDSIALTTKTVERRIPLHLPLVDALRDEFVWGPDNPALVDAILEILDADGTVLDTVLSYTALRSIKLRFGQFLLNDRPCPLRMVLDQGYWPETGLTALDSAALRYDVELAKDMGFNGVRKHQKIEDPRYLYWADRLGLMVWVEMPPSYRFDARAVRRTFIEWSDAIERCRDHPCVITWVTFNESCGLLNLPGQPAQRHYVEAMGLLTRTLDPSRPVLGNDGWEAIGGDVIGVHDYDQDPERLALRYSPANVSRTLSGYGNNGRLVSVDDPSRPVLESAESGEFRPLILSEFGGVGYSPDQKAIDISEMAPDAPAPVAAPDVQVAWGYSTVGNPQALAERYSDLLAAVHSVDAFAGFCYTQFTDVYQEVNGLLYGDRTPKVPIEEIRRATLGPTATEAEKLRTRPRLVREGRGKHRGEVGRVK